MRLKNIVLVGILVLYAGYYAGVSNGFIKKNAVACAAGEGFIQQIIDAVTPLSPEEKRMESNERLEFLKMQLAAATDNLASYEKWRANAAANPPS